MQLNCQRRVRTRRQGRREGGQGGHVPCEIPTLKIFLSKRYRICDIQSNIQHVLGKGFYVAALLGTEPPFCPPPKQIPGYAPTHWLS